MNGPLQSTVVITNPHGFHLRPKAAFSQLAARFQSSITVTWEGIKGDGKSIMDLLLIPAPQGSELTLEADGPDAPAALEALAALLRAPMPDDPDGLDP